GVFIGLAESRIVKDLLDEFVDGQALVEDEHAGVDELGGDFADDADAEQFFVGAGEDEFQHAESIAGNVAACVVRVVRAASAKIDLFFAAGIFRFADGGNLRNRVNPHGKHGGYALLVLESKSMTDGDAALFHRSGSERGKADDVAGGVDVRHGSAIVGIHRKIPAIVDGEASFFQREAINSGAAAGGEERGFGLQDFSAFHGEIHASGRRFHFYRALVEQELHAQRGEPFAKAFRDFSVKEREQT